MNLQKYVPSNADLDNYTSEGVYICQTKVIADTIINKPNIINTGFKLLVIPVSAITYGIQIIIPANSSNVICKRCFAAGSWGTWYYEDLYSLTTKSKDSLVDAVNEVNNSAVKIYEISYYNSNKNEVIEQLDFPTMLTGSINTVYVLLFTDTVGDSPLYGGISCVYGYTYNDDSHGVQIAIRYSGAKISIRNKINSTWSAWNTIG